MTHAQKPDFVFRRNGRVHLNRRGRQFSRILAAEVCASAVVMLDTPCRGSVKSTGYPLHSPVSPSLPLPSVTVCHHISAGLQTFTLNAGFPTIGLRSSSSPRKSILVPVKMFTNMYLLFADDRNTFSDFRPTN